MNEEPPKLPIIPSHVQVNQLRLQESFELSNLQTDLQTLNAEISAKRIKFGRIKTNYHNYVESLSSIFKIILNNKQF